MPRALAHAATALLIVLFARPASGFELGRFRYQPEAPPPSDAGTPAGAQADPEFTLAPAPRFGAEGTTWVTLGALGAYDFDNNTDANVHGMISHFVVEDLEIGFELGLWGHMQEGDDALGISPNLVIRWHFAHDAEKDWTVYADTGVGMLFSTDNVPEGGTGFNFMPRAGVGFTHRLGEGETRLVAGVRWHHISNARINGEARNPSRDAPAIYAGLAFPF